MQDKKLEIYLIQKLDQRIFQFASYKKEKVVWIISLYFIYFGQEKLCLYGCVVVDFIKLR